MSGELAVHGRVVLAGSLAERTEGRLFFFVEDAHGGGLLLNRAYELSDEAFETAADGARVLAFELGEEHRIGSAATDGHLQLIVRLDGDGEVLTSEDSLAMSRTPFDAGGGPVDVVLRPSDG